MSAPLTVNFELASAVLPALSQEFIAQLREMIEAAKVGNRGLIITGHACNLRIFNDETKVRYPTNHALSAARAASVSNYVINDLGLDAKLVLGTFVGSEKPLPEGGEAVQNRRAVIQLCSISESA